MCLGTPLLRIAAGDVGGQQVLALFGSAPLPAARAVPVGPVACSKPRQSPLSVPSSGDEKGRCWAGFWGWEGARSHLTPLTRVGVEAPGGELERGVVAAPAGLVGVVAAALHGELVQPGGVGALVPDGGKRPPHGAGVRHHLQAAPAGDGVSAGVDIPWGAPAGPPTTRSSVTQWGGFGERPAWAQSPRMISARIGGRREVG